MKCSTSRTVRVLTLAAMTAIGRMMATEGSLAAAETPAPATAPATAPAPLVAKPGQVVGRVVDSQGKPLAGVTITVDHDLFYNSNIQVKTKADGIYRVEVPNGSYRVTAELKKEFNDKTYRLPLHPEETDSFAASEGAVRNFQLRLSGKMAEPNEGEYGGFIVANTAVGEYDVELKDVELTLTPDGPLIDGTAGKPITKKLVPTGDGMAIKGIPIGKYKVTAREVKKGQKPAPLTLRPGNEEEYRPEVTAEFESPYGSLAIYRFTVDVKRAK